MKKWFAALLIALPVFLEVNASVDSLFLHGKGINPSSSAMLVVPVVKGEPLMTVNSSVPLIPASVMKCVTTASLLECTGVDFTYKTGVYLAGNVVDSVLHGNLIVEGSGDPSLNSRHVADTGDFCRQIANALKENGVARITGKIIVDESVWSGPSFPSSWASGDLPHAYGTASHGLNFEDNASGSRSVKYPASVFANRLKAALRLNQISLEENIVANGEETLLIEHESVPLDEIMRSCMMRSDNQYAEALFRTYAVQNGKAGSIENAAKGISKRWKKGKAPMDGVNIVDGSGLSRQNRLTAEFLTYVLRAHCNDPYYASFFPLAGQEGTLKRFLAGTSLEGYVAMKTGSMNGIQCYAGYKLNEDYEPTHIVVVLLNELRDRAAARSVIENILLNLFSE